MTTLNTENLNRTVFISNNLPFLRSLDNESVDLVVIDPPFGKQQTFTGNLKPPLEDKELENEYNLLTSWGVQNEDDAYEIGLEFPDQTGTTANFNEIWDFRYQATEADWNRVNQYCPAAKHLIEATRYTHSDHIAGYITFMTLRMIEIRRVLKDTGSVYIHCDHTANAYLRQMMDAIFGKDNFRNEIVWAYSGGGVPKKDYPRKHDVILRYTKTSEYIFNKEYRPYGKHNTTGMRATTLGGTRKAEYRKEGTPVTDWWIDIKPVINWSKERSGYPTQKPQALARRIIKASCNPGDIVLDCFAGCAYVPVAAEQTGRRWIACDMSPRAWTVVRRQFEKQPDLIIATEGERIDHMAVQLEDADKIIRVRGPHELPMRTTVDDAPKKTDAMPPIEFKQTAIEDGDTIWAAFVEAWGTGCWYCGTDKPANRRELQLDHIEPNTKDGRNDDRWNRALACAPCNGDKRNKLTVEETMDKALEAGRIATQALRDEQIGRFEERHDWAKQTWNDIKP